MESNVDLDFEVISLDQAQNVGRSSGLFAATSSGYNSDSSSDELSVQVSRKGPLPDIVKSTGVSTEKFSDLESDEEMAESLDVGSEKRVTGKFVYDRTQVLNQSDSGSESDTPMESFKKIGKKNVLPKVKTTSIQNKGSSLKHKQTVKKEELHKERLTGRLPEFRGTAMLDLLPETSITKQIKNQFDGVQYGADILADLFDSDSSDTESSENENAKNDVLDFTDLQGAVNNLLGLNQETISDSNTKKDSDSEESMEEASTDPKLIKGENKQHKHQSYSVDLGFNHAETIQRSDMTSEKLIVDSDSFASSSEEEEEVINIKPTKDVKSVGDNSDRKNPRGNHLSTNTLVTSEFVSGLSGTNSPVGDTIDHENDSDTEDLLDLVSSGKMKKVVEYEKKAIENIIGKKEKNLIKGNSKNAEIKDKLDRLNRSEQSKSQDSTDGNFTIKVKHLEKRPKTKQEKHELDNKRRIESMRQKEQEARNHKAVISKALASLVSLCHDNSRLKVF